jgi:isopropylmalate/homocitrate/citramalate synthase
VLSCLVPNIQGLEKAIQVGADEIAIFSSASEAFSQKVCLHTYVPI